VTCGSESTKEVTPKIKGYGLSAGNRASWKREKGVVVTFVFVLRKQTPFTFRLDWESVFSALLLETY
jgi:hypothetical protein